MCDETTSELKSFNPYKKLRKLRSLVLNVDILQFALAVASFGTRLVNLDTPSAVV